MSYAAFEIPAPAATPEFQALQDSLTSLLEKGEYAEALPLCRDAVNDYRQKRGDQDELTLILSYFLGYALLGMENCVEAESVFRETLRLMRQTLGDGHPKTLNAANTLAMTLWRQAKVSEAEQLQRVTVPMMRKELGERHPLTLTSTAEFVAVLMSQKKFVEASPLLEDYLSSWYSVEEEGSSSSLWFAYCALHMKHFQRVIRRKTS